MPGAGGWIISRSTPVGLPDPGRITACLLHPNCFANTDSRSHQYADRYANCSGYAFANADLADRERSGVSLPEQRRHSRGTVRG
jgi:hypothetical protein